MKKNYLFAYLISLLILTGCSSSPNHIIFYPDVSFSNTIITSGTADINVVDERTLYALVSVKHPDDSVTYLKPSEDIQKRFNQQFREGFASFGVLHQVTADTAITIKLNQIHVEIMQTHFNYKATMRMEVLVEITQTPDKFSKTFYASGEQQGPLSFDKARIERDLNALAGRLINDVITDEEIRKITATLN